MISSINPVSVNANGQFIYVTLATKQLMGNTPNAFWLLVEPPGVTFISASVGVYAPYAGPPPGTTARVDLGPLNAGQSSTTILTYAVNAIGLGPFTFSAGINGSDTNLTNNSFVGTVFNTFTPPIGLTLDSSGCICDTVADIDTPCSSCTSEWRIVAGSETNVIFDYYDPSTGQYRVRYIDMTQPISWLKELYCINCADGNDYFVSGPAIHTIQPWAAVPLNPIFVQEDFNVLPGTLSVNLAFPPVAGYAIVAEVGGATLALGDFNVVGTTVNFTAGPILPFGGAGPTIGVVIHYFR